MPHTENIVQLSEYKSRINKVFDHIENNIDHPFSLEELAEIANFSKYHFHRIFWAMVGETPVQFLHRIRLERAATLLVMHPQTSISDIAYQCGFSNISIFSRNFKSHFKVSASTYRKEMLNKISINENSKISQIKSNNKTHQDKITAYFCSESKTLKWRTNMNLNKSVEVKELPEMNVAYVRHTGPYKGDEKLFERLFNKLCSWAGPKGLMAQSDLKSIVVYHDDPSVTEQDKLRMSVCITIPDNTKVSGEIGKMVIKDGSYVMAKFELNGQQFQEAWSWLYGTWFPESGYQPDDGPCFEMYVEEPKDNIYPVYICVPVKPL